MWGKVYMGDAVTMQQYIGMGWDWVEDARFPLFHCFFEMCVIPKSLLKILFFTLLVYLQTLADN